MTHPSKPPVMDFFETERAPAGDHGFAIALGPLRIDLEGLDEPLFSAIEERWGPWCVPADAGTRGLRVRVGREARDYFIAPPKTTETQPVLLECDGDRVRLASYRAAGWFDTEDGEGCLLLSEGEFESRALATENFVRAAVAWQSLSRGGALVHSSSAEFFSHRPDLFERLERSFVNLPLARLGFRKDDSYWDAIARAGL